jgi:hypothetical protein
METVDAKAAQPIENPHRVKASKLYDTENAQVVHITLEPSAHARCTSGKTSTAPYGFLKR